MQRFLLGAVGYFDVPFSFLFFFFLILLVLRIYLAAWLHAGLYPLNLFEPTDKKNKKKKRMIAYFAFVLLNEDLVEKKSKHLAAIFDGLAQMIPVHVLALHNVDDDTVFKTQSDERLLIQAVQWLGDKKNRQCLADAASWLINHRIDPIEQRGKITLQSFLGKKIMEYALEGIHLEDYAKRLKDSSNL